MNSSNINDGHILPMKQCELSDFNITQADFDSNRLAGAYCVQNLQSQLTELNGYWINSYMTFLGIYVGPCVPGLRPGITCKSLEEIQAYLYNNPLAVQIQFQNYAYDPTNFANPLTYYIKTNGYMILLYFGSFLTSANSFNCCSKRCIGLPASIYSISIVSNTKRV